MAWGDRFKDDQTPPPPADDDFGLDRFKKQPPGVIEDVLRGTGAGLRRGIEGIPAAPQDLLNLAAIGAAYISGKLGASPETQASIRSGADIPYLPSSEDIHEKTSEVIGKSYEPQTTAGKFGATMGEFVPGFVGGGGIVKNIGKVGLGALAGGASEAAGQATAGSQYEPLARVVAGITGAALPQAAISAGKNISTAGAREAEAAAEDAAARHGVRLTAGQRSGDVSQQMAEQQMLHGTRGERAQNLMQVREQENLQAIKDAALGIQDTTAPTRATDPVTSAQNLQQQLQDRVSGYKSEGGRAIDEAVNAGVLFDADRLRGLPAELEGKLAGNVPFVPDVNLGPNTPIASDAMERVRNFVKQAEDPNIKEVGMSGAEALRKQLTKLVAQAGTEDARALRKVKSYFDEWYDQSIDDARFAPDASALPGGREPRDVLAGLKAGRSTYKKGLDIERPQGKPPGGQQVSKIAEKTTLPENTRRLLTPNDRGELSTQALETIDRLVKTGATDADLDQVRGIILDQLMTGDPGKVATRIDNFTRNNPTAAGHLFDPGQLEDLKGWAATNRKLVPDPKATNPSKSSYGIVRELSKQGARAATSQGGVIGSVLGGPLGAVVGTGMGMAGEAANQLLSGRKAKQALAPADRSTPGQAARKGAAVGTGKAGLGSLQAGQTATIDDPGGPDDGRQGKIIEIGENMVKMKMPDGSVRQVGRRLLQ